ncbi:MAG: S-layer homology domain-containing protein [Candidatus Peribacteraceae bacterium]
MRHTTSFCSLARAAFLCGLLAAATPAFAEQSFSDVGPDHPIYQAAEYLKAQGIIAGYDDGTFKPERLVNRAEALKIIIAPLISPEALSQVTSSPFTDVPAGSWFLPYVEAARVNGIVDGPPKKEQFLGANPVIKAEFLKMLELAQQTNPATSFQEITLPLASDVQSSTEWFYPYMRYAITSSMIMIGTDGLLHPEQQLTRGDTALFLYRLLMYQQERRTQALLSETENEMVVILSMLEGDNIEQAEYASARALLAALGANFKRPNEPIVQGAVKISEAFRKIVAAYRSGRSGDLESVVSLCGEAWNLAERAKDLSADLSLISEQVQTIASNMADSARALMAQ